MRTLNKNKQVMYYALHLDSKTIYKLDDYGKPIVSYIDRTTEPETIYYEELAQLEDCYDAPNRFKACIVFSGGSASDVEYGVNTESYQAVLIADKDEVPIDETSLIWVQTEPQVDEYGNAIPSSADYRVIKVNHSLNSDKYILSKVTK